MRFALRPWLIACALLLPAAPLAPSPARAQDAATDLTPRQILDKSLDQNGLGFSAGQVRMTLTTTRDGATDVKELLVQSRKRADDANQARVTLLAPSDIAGEAYLFLGKPKGEDDVYMFLPAFKETRKVSGREKNGRFLGTELTFSDLETRDLKDSEAKRLPDQTLGKHAAFVIEVTPEGKSDYSRVVTYIRQDDFMPLQVEFFGQGGARVKRMFSEKIARDGDTPYVKRMTLFTEGGAQTTLELTEVDFNATLPDALFSKDALGQ
jgi:outer membrane lipoprotein-sorting protein